MNINKIQLFILVTVFLSACGSKQWLIADEEVDRYQINKYNQEDEEIKNLIDPFKSQLDQKMNVVIGEISKSMVKKRPESTLGNWMADGLVAKANELTGLDIDFGVQNYGGIRIPSIEKGQLTVGKIYELMPFDNTLVVLQISGATTRKLFGRIAEYGGWPVSKEIRMNIKSDTDFDVMISGEPLDDNKQYNIAILDYIANGGDKCDFLVGEKQVNTEKFIRDILIDYAKDLTAQGENITAEIEGRITKAKK